MEYIDVQWLHSNPEDPVRLVSELGPDRHEIRKLEFWRDGRVGYASKAGASHDTRLGEGAVPRADAINMSAEFSATEIDARTFEQLWDRYCRGLPLIECVVTFLTSDEGGRAKPFPPGGLSGDVYRPHIVIGDSSQRRAIIDKLGRAAEEYIGIAFSNGPQQPIAGSEMRVIVTLMYYPHRMYEKLLPGTTFTLREGAHIVGHGVVDRWLDRFRASD
jgi:hypothetical protein